MYQNFRVAALEWLAALGSSVVLLSATLPESRRKSLAAKFLKGLGSNAPVSSGERYPRVTWGSAASSGVEHVETSQSKTISLEWVGGRALEGSRKFELGERLKAALEDGGCAAVVCNTVKRAQQVYCALKPFFSGSAADGHPQLDLFHARYLFKDRDEREKRASSASASKERASTLVKAGAVS